MLELELHQLDRRYEGLRQQSPERERRLLSSLLEVGQQTPLVVVKAPEGSGYVVVDGYKRMRCLHKLGRDVVFCTCWELGEAEALLLERLLRMAGADSAVAQGWFLKTLVESFGLSEAELGRRFDKSESWVSRRVGLVRILPPEVLQHVQSGAIAAHAAQKHLLPLARANREDCLTLVRGISGKKLASRQVGELHAAYVSGNAKTRELVLANPCLYLRTLAESRKEAPKVKEDVATQLRTDLGILSAVSRRAHRRLREGAGAKLLAQDKAEMQQIFIATKADMEQLQVRFEQELCDVGSEHARGDSKVTSSGAQSSGDSASPQDFAHGSGGGDS